MCNAKHTHEKGTLARLFISLLTLCLTCESEWVCVHGFYQINFLHEWTDYYLPLIFFSSHWMPRTTTARHILSALIRSHCCDWIFSIHTQINSDILFNMVSKSRASIASKCESRKTAFIRLIWKLLEGEKFPL